MTPAKPLAKTEDAKQHSTHLRCNMEKKSTALTAIQSVDVEETSTSTANDQPDMASNSVPEEKTRKPRRSAKEIWAEYEKFKTLFEEGRPLLEISRLMGIRKAQCDSYLIKISREKNNQEQQYGVCEGHCLPESIRKTLGGDRKDLFKFEPVPNGVLVSLFTD